MAYDLGTQAALDPPQGGRRRAGTKEAAPLVVAEAVGRAHATGSNPRRQPTVRISARRARSYTRCRRRPCCPTARRRRSTPRTSRRACSTRSRSAEPDGREARCPPGSREPIVPAWRTRRHDRNPCLQPHRRLYGRRSVGRGTRHDVLDEPSERPPDAGPVPVREVRDLPPDHPRLTSAKAPAPPLRRGPALSGTLGP